MDKTFWDRVKARSKPTVAFVPRTSYWMCVAYDKGLGRFVTGQAAKPETAYNAYKRRVKWYASGMPGGGHRRS